MKRKINQSLNFNSPSTKENSSVGQERTDSKMGTGKVDMSTSAD